MDLDFKNLALFVRVSEMGKIGRAGEDFGFSSTNASQRIQHLEATLGIKLFHRSTRVVSLTYDGQVFLEHAKRLLDELEETRNVFKGERNKVQGIIRLTVSASYGRIYIVPFIPKLLALYPELEIDIDFTDKQVDIVEQGYDIAFRMGELKSNSLLARRIANNPSVIVASPEYLAQHGTPNTPQELSHHTCIPFAGQHQWTFKDKLSDMHEVSVKGPISVNWGDAISDLTEAGVGIGMASLWHAGPSIKAGRVFPILSDYRVWPETRIWAVRPPGRLTPVRIKVFLDYMETVIRQTNHQRYGDELNTLNNKIK
ncbi:LysR family transcriptional regulator [Shewanella olleyana]|uniref:LysR family transcriptional regulator n=1 Tax=Shewanella olleyana TaxID=135626 RepID=UPI00200F8D7F|nr:LysR family transcriptional regulator [Shewanella olleyana]MCL1065697.1 LysR family transcriptional regulator [Shewanella olleyana]